ARKYMMNYLQKNPPINEQMLKMMMMQMGQKPSQKKINQMMSAMNKQQMK
ncbi:YneF family protein, partial [Bacillus anthracis]